MTDALASPSTILTQKLFPQREFYKSFTRPVAKVLLLAVFTYQFAYWSWIKMEADEVRSERDATIASLEAKVAEYEKTVKPETKRN
jgi:hypothetical protein